MRYKHQLIIAFVGLINVFLHLLPSVNFEYHRDELLYFSLVNHLDFGYATTPPLIGLMAFISKSLFGYSVFSIRLFPALFSGLLVYLTSMIAKELNGNFRSQLISAIGVVGTTFVSMIYGVFTPYFIDIFLWTLVIYSIIFLIVSAFVVLPFTKYRYIFSNKFFYWALLLSVLIASPNIIWQIYYHFPVLNHMKELNESQLANVNRLEFVVGQFILLLPFTFVILPGIVFFIVNKQFKDYRFLLSISLVVIILFLILRGKSFYVSGLYPFFIAIGALFIEKIVVNRYVFSTVLVIIILMSVSLLPLNIPVFKPQQMISYFNSFAKITGIDLLRKDEDGNYRKLPQVNADMLGWNEITEKTNKAWSMVEDKNKCFIFCANYGQAGAISIIGKKYGLPEPISFSDAYRFWLPKNFKNNIEEIVYIIGSDAMDSRNFNDTKDYFSEMIEIGKVENQLAIEYDTRIYLFKKPKDNFNEFWRRQISGYYKTIK
jgi:hypothetical protein